MAFTAAQITAKFDAFSKAYPLGGHVISHCTGNTHANCVDLADIWAEKYLLKGCFRRIGNADDTFYYADPAKWTKIKNSPLVVPRKGDIVVAHTEHPAGHICIDRGGSTVHTVNSRDQNYSHLYRISNEQHPYGASYFRVIGWLRAR